MLRRSFLMVAAVAIMAAWSGQSVAQKEQPGTHEGTVVKAEEGKLTMLAKDNKTKHIHNVGPDAKITCDGKDCKLTELKAGYEVKVTIEKKGTENVVTKVEAKKA
jgi:hypothetical protein